MGPFLEMGYPWVPFSSSTWLKPPPIPNVRPSGIQSLTRNHQKCHLSGWEWMGKVILQLFITSHHKLVRACVLNAGLLGGLGCWGCWDDD